MADSAQILASSMVNRKQAEREPYVLVLGAGASISSGCSSYPELVESFLKQYCPDDVTELNQEPDERARAEAKRERFYQEWRHLSPVNRYAFLSPHLGGGPSAGYEHLAWLVRNAYLRVILSTNIDNHVESAFTHAGIVPNQHYELVVNALGRGPEVTRRLEAPTPPVKLVKLHGTLSDEETYAWLPEEVFEFEDELAEALAGYLNRDVIILGNRMDDRDLDLPFRAKGGEVWFVNPGGARDTRFKAVLDVRSQGRSVTGEAGRFDGFLASLRSHVEGAEQGKETPEKVPAIHRFLPAIGLSAQIREPRSRYLHLPELYVKPREYESMLNTLDKHHALVIAGEPHMGKTYTALHILWERFQQGWSVGHMTRDALAGELQQSGHSIDEFATRHLTRKCILHLDDPFGETEYQPLGALQKGLATLLAEARRRADCAVIVTSRIGIFSQALGHLEGAEALRAMGVEADIRVHTSYSEETLREVLQRYLNLYRPPWTADEALLTTALQRVPTILEAPHNLELFARRSEGISGDQELLAFARECREMVSALRDWVGRLPPEDQLVLVLTRRFAHTADLAGLRAFHREVLARAYAEGLIEHVPATAWDSALARLSDILTLRDDEDEDEPALSFVHPSYFEASGQALSSSPQLRSLCLTALTRAAGDARLEWRRAAATALASDYGHLDAAGRNLLASLAGDEAEEVRGRLAWGLGRNYGNLDAAGRRLLASLAAGECQAVRAKAASGLAASYDHLDAAGRKLVASLAGDKAEQVRARLAGALAGNYAKPDVAGRRLLASLAADRSEEVRTQLAAGLAWNYRNLEAAERQVLVSLAADRSEQVRIPVAAGLAANYRILDPTGRKLLSHLGADRSEQVRIQVAATLARNYPILDAAGRSLLPSLATDQAQKVRSQVAWGLAVQYGHLDAAGRTLLASLAADKSRWVRAEPAFGLAVSYQALDAAGHKLLGTLAADRAVRVRAMVASGLAFSYHHLDRAGRHLLAALANDRAQEVRGWLAEGLRENYDNLDAAGRDLVASLTREPARKARRTSARGVRRPRRARPGLSRRVPAPPPRPRRP